jgi:hypothetical protein
LQEIVQQVPDQRRGPFALFLGNTVEKVSTCRIDQNLVVPLGAVHFQGCKSKRTAVNVLPGNALVNVLAPTVLLRFATGASLLRASVPHLLGEGEKFRCSL